MHRRYTVSAQRNKRKNKGKYAARERAFLRVRHLTDMNPAVMVLANRSLSFSLYDFYLEGVSLQELAAAYSLPVHCVEERIEAVRFCLQFQAKVALDTRQAFDQRQAA